MGDEDGQKRCRWCPYHAKDQNDMIGHMAGHKNDKMLRLMSIMDLAELAMLQELTSPTPDRAVICQLLAETFYSRRSDINSLKKKERTAKAVVYKFPALGIPFCIEKEFLLLHRKFNREYSVAKMYDVLNYIRIPVPSRRRDTGKASHDLMDILNKLHDHIKFTSKNGKLYKPSISELDLVAFKQEKLSQSSGPPRLVVCGNLGFIVADGLHIECTSSTLADMIIDLLMVYNVYGIDYPKQYQVLGFLDRQTLDLGRRHNFEHSSKHVDLEWNHRDVLVGRGPVTFGEVKPDYSKDNTHDTECWCQPGYKSIRCKQKALTTGKITVPARPELQNSTFQLSEGKQSEKVSGAITLEDNAEAVLLEKLTSPTPDRMIICQLLAKTFNSRRSFIKSLKKECTAKAVVYKFPALGIPFYIEKEFLMLHKAFNREYSVAKMYDVLNYIRIPDPSRRRDTGKETCGIMDILNKLHDHIKFPGKNGSLHKPSISELDPVTFMKEKSSQSSGPPRLVMCGNVGFIVADGIHIECTSSTLPDMIIDLLMVYNVFGIDYPKQYQVLGFLDRQTLGLGWRNNFVMSSKQIYLEMDHRDVLMEGCSVTDSELKYEFCTDNKHDTECWCQPGYKSIRCKKKALTTEKITLPERPEAQNSTFQVMGSKRSGMMLTDEPELKRCKFTSKRVLNFIESN